MERQRPRVPGPAGLRLVALVAVGQSGRLVRPEQQPVDVLPGVVCGDRTRRGEVLLEELFAARCAEGALERLRQAVRQASPHSGPGSQ